MRYMTSLALTLALAAPLAAQLPKTPPPAAPAKASSAEKIVTASGCLGGGPSGYTLSTAIAGGSPHDEAEAHVGVGTTGATLSYTLTARDGVNLRELVGKKVEVRGVLQAEAPASRPSKAADSGAPNVKQDDSPEAGRPRGRAAEAVVSPRIAVTSVQLLSATCQ